MLREKDQYIRVKLSCHACFSLVYCRVLARQQSATIHVDCPQCHQDIVAAIVPDKMFDGAKQENDLWIVPLYDLICLQSGLTEEEGDRLLYGLENVLESRINSYVKGES